MNHAARDHAVLSASGAHRWMTCPASAMLEQQFPDTASDAAKEGTLAHELAEAKVKQYFFPDTFSRQKLAAVVRRLKKDSLWEDEMDRYTEEYLDYIKREAISFSAIPYVAVEKRIDFSDYVPEGFGTADCILISGSTLHVIDLKYGKGVPVSAEENPQMLLYALGAYEAYRMIYPIEEVALSIVQPRLPDGNSKWKCSVKQLLRFGQVATEMASKALSEDAEFNPEDKVCRFCRANAQCRARAEKNIQLAFFTDKKPPLISDEEVGQYLLRGEDIAKWVKDLQGYALTQCLAGKDIPGWKAVEGRGSREWTDLDEAFQNLQENGVDGSLLWEQRPLTVAQVEKVIGKKEFAACAQNFVVKNPGKPTLVKSSDKRVAITNKMSAEEAFKEE